MEEGKYLNVSISTAALQGRYLAEIQNLLDIITFVYRATETLTEERYQSPLGFMSVHPAHNRRLSFAEAHDHSKQWLLGSFLTDSVNATGSFLDECRKVCALYRLGGKGRFVGQEFKDIFAGDRKRFHRLGFPDKFGHLRSDFGVETPYERHFLSLNQARNCLVHRNGIVAPEDTNQEGRLVVTWRTVEFLAKPPGEGDEIVIEGQTRLDAGWSVSLRSTDRERSFDVGKRIELTVPELYQSILTLHALASSLVKSIEAYGVSQGVVKSGSQPMHPTREGMGSHPQL